MSPTRNRTATILIADDSKTQRDGLQFLLEESGFATLVAADGTEALATAQASPIDLIVSDIVMPGLDGFALCEAVRLDPALQRVPVILLTALSDPRDVLRGVESGANGFVTKPYEEEFFISEVHRALACNHLYADDSSSREVKFCGENYVLDPHRPQVLDFLLSTYANAAQQNATLLRSQVALRTLNEELEKKVGERTAALVAEVQERMRLYEELSKRQEALRASEEKLRVAEKLARDMSNHDDLTGLLNHRGFNGLAERILRLARRARRPATLIFADLDGLKRINDSIGHSEGDRAIQATADILRATFRDTDVIGRLGGDEFSILLPDIDSAGAAASVGRLEEQVRAFNVAGARAYTLGLSVGVLTCEPGDRRSLADLLKQADAVMYAEKWRRKALRGETTPGAAC